MAQERLRIGDIITLRHPKPYDGWLTSEGIIDVECHLNKEKLLFEETLWQVTVQYQYRAICEYEEALSYKDDIQLEDKQEYEAKLAQLKRAALNEQRLDKKLMEMKIGKPVAFGDVIQLLHVKSQTFLTISAKTLAKQERENIRVYLKENGDPLSWLEFMPRFKYDKEGQQIVHENECHIRVHERPSEFIHAARKISKFSTNGNREINCSLENSVWTISIYQQCWEAKSKNILSGQLVSLQETETSSYLGVEATQRSNPQTKAVSLCPQQLSLTVSDCNVGTNLLWMIEGENPFHGGQVTHKAGRYALRDLNSGMYMKLEPDGMVAVPNRANCSYFEFIGSQGLDNGAPIQDNGMVQIMNQNQWICMKKSANLYKSQGTGSDDRSHALSFIISSKIQHTLHVDLFVGVEAFNLFQNFKTLVQTKKIHSLSVGQVENEFKSLFSCLDTLTLFLNQPTQHLSEENEMMAILEPSGAASFVIRQTMLREQGILNALLDIIEMTAIGLLDELDGNPRLKKLASQASRPLDEFHEHSHDLESEDSSSDHTTLPKNRSSFVGSSINQEHLKRLSIAMKQHREKKNRATFANVVLQAMEDRRGSSSSGHGHGHVVPSMGKSQSAKHFVHSPSSSSKSRPTVEKEDLLASLPKELARCCFNVLFLAIVRNHQSQIHIADYFSLLLNQVHSIPLACHGLVLILSASLSVCLSVCTR
jgi:hypothetical protein